MRPQTASGRRPGPCGTLGGAAIVCGVAFALGSGAEALAGPRPTPGHADVKERSRVEIAWAAVEAVPWGATGHRFAARAAAAGLPEEMPTFFLDAGAQLEFLDPEPDRWKAFDLPAMDRAFEFDHYIDLENLPDGALAAPDRWTYLDRIYAAGLDDPVRTTGFLPYRIVELHQRLVVGWRLWHEAGSVEERRWIQERIVNDAGILGHYVTDACQPHHTTIHFNGWADGVPNPEGFTTDRDFHARFESHFVDAHVAYGHVAEAVSRHAVRRVDDVRSAVLDHIRESHGEVEHLYRLEARVGFSPELPPDADARAFAVERLAAGAAMLRDLWWTAWLEGAGR